MDHDAQRQRVLTLIKDRFRNDAYNSVGARFYDYIMRGGKFDTLSVRIWRGREDMRTIMGHVADELAQIKSELILRPDQAIRLNDLPNLVSRLR
ncbi:MAG TPA: hypothetical protein VF597_04475 [Candidatus Saccharimonadales bacterium]|jgi:hypothetical protein